MRSILEYLEHSAATHSEKIALEDPFGSCSYGELTDRAQRIGSALAAFNRPGSPVIVYMEKCVEAVASFMGIVYAGCFYIFISPDQLPARIRQILDVTEADCVIVRGDPANFPDEIRFTGKILCYNELVQIEIAEDLLQCRRESARDVDPLYCNFTSGSTGVPKGVLVSHRSVIDFMDYFPELFHITERDVIGNQAPFDFDVSVKDIYSAFKTGATVAIIPKKYFSIPMRLMDYLCDRKVTTLIWAVSALCIVTQLKGLTYRVPKDVDKILFSGEMMPVKHLRLWQKYLPDASYVNLYGPTEITCNCTYYRIERDFDLDEKIPIGRPFPNEKVFLLDDKDREITERETVGEICVSGTALALGYYNNPEQTRKSFVQNPANTHFIEPVYRTGDLAFFNRDGDLYFVGRKDFQIKFMGHRIELEEIETVLNSLPGIQRACCTFDADKNRIVAFVVGDIESAQIQQELYKNLPSYMVPAVYYLLPELPVTENGKIDRRMLLTLCEGR